MTKQKRHHLYASLSALTLVGGALLLLWLGQRLIPDYQKTLMVREVATLSLPPPPPPPPSAPQRVEQNLISVAVEGTGAALELSLSVPEPKALALTAPEPVLSLEQDWQADLSVDWQAFGLDELDGLPQLLTRVKTSFPLALSRRGIDKAVVRLDVFIDEQGKLSLVAITENSYPELSDAINKLVQGSRFSAPTRGGAPVKARFIWPVEFKKS